MKGIQTIVQLIYYLLLQLGPSDKIKLVKLLYLADKYHLIHYGRTITNDNYYAMEHCPVGSASMDVLNFNSEILASNDLAYASGLIYTIDTNIFEAVPSLPVDNLDMLSDSDKDALNFIAGTFGGENKWDLRNYTHQYPEWCQYEASLNKDGTKRVPIATKDLLSLLEDDPLFAPQEHILQSREMVTGNFD